MPREVMSGNHAQSEAVALARVQVIAAYPITPQTTIVEALADRVASGALPAQYVKVESEHSALQTVVSAAALGARTYTATSGQGLLLMHELLHWASGMRTPVVMGVVNRAVAPPWSIGADHSDSISQRDTGWIQFYAESNQEVLDTVLEAFRLAEHPEVRLPAMVMEDAFYLSHTVEPVEVPSAASVDAFLPRRARVGSLVPGRAMRLGSFTGPQDWVRFRWETAEAMARAAILLPSVETEYERCTGRALGGMVPEYRTEDADAILLTMGTASTTARTVVDDLRAAGRRVGLAKLRVFRPFPADALRDLASTGARIGVLDRSYTFGAMGAVATEVAAALYDGPVRPSVRGFVAGLGGRDVTPALLERIFEDLLSGRGPESEWVDLLEPRTERIHGEVNGPA